MIKVCDCITGGGKSSACINYMNAHPDQKFIYITPYTDEATRIKDACPELNFYEPSRLKKESDYSKSKDTVLMVAEGRNIASTHQCFKFYLKDMLDNIRDKGYTLMVDENVDVLQEEKDLTEENVGMMEAYGYIERNDGEYTATGKECHGGWAQKSMRLLQSRELIEFGNSGKSYYYWALPKDLLLAFKDVIIMTYMFYGTDMYYYLKMNGIEYTEIGVRHDDTGYHFTDSPSIVTDQMRDFINKIHICEKTKMNEVGDGYYALSINWLKKPESDMARLKKNMSNWFNNYNRGVPKEKRLWATVDDSYGQLRSYGVWNNNLAFNYRAINSYSDRTVLAYPVNVFVNVNKKKFYARKGLKYDEERYALSMMIQWIWRSAIRNGEEISIYIPSRRMRDLFKKWLVGLANSKPEGLRSDDTAQPGERGCVVSGETVLPLPVG